MSKAYSDIFFDWLLKELRDEKNFTLLSDNITLAHRNHDIKISSFQSFSFEIIIIIKLNGTEISDLVPSVMKPNYKELYFRTKKYYLDSYDETNKTRGEAELNDFVFNNLMNY